jgi:hypothetical protein
MTDLTAQTAMTEVSQARYSSVSHKLVVHVRTDLAWLPPTRTNYSPRRVDRWA